MLRRAALVVEGDEALGRPRQVVTIKPDARVKLIGVPLDLRHDAPRFPRALRLIADFVRRSPDQVLEQVSDSVLQDGICRQPGRVADARGFKEFVDLQVSKGSVAAKIQALHDPLVADELA